LDNPIDQQGAAIEHPSRYGGGFTGQSSNRYSTGTVNSRVVAKLTVIIDSPAPDLAGCIDRTGMEQASRQVGDIAQGFRFFLAFRVAHRACGCAGRRDRVCKTVNQVQQCP
jgi:hypothetical protein